MLGALLEKKKQTPNYKIKGFTLVEMMVVLVILTVLVGVVVPSMNGWIDKAKEAKLLVNARSAHLAVQTLLSEDYIKAEPVYLTSVGAPSGSINTETANELYDEALKLAGLSSLNAVDESGNENKRVEISDVKVDQEATVTYMIYTEDGKSLKLEDGQWVEWIAEDGSGSTDPGA